MKNSLNSILSELENIFTPWVESFKGLRRTTLIDSINDARYQCALKKAIDQQESFEEYLKELKSDRANQESQQSAASKFFSCKHKPRDDELEHLAIVGRGVNALQRKQDPVLLSQQIESGERENAKFTDFLKLPVKKQRALLTDYFILNVLYSPKNARCNRTPFGVLLNALLSEISSQPIAQVYHSLSSHMATFARLADKAKAEENTDRDDDLDDDLAKQASLEAMVAILGDTALNQYLDAETSTPSAWEKLNALVEKNMIAYASCFTIPEAFGNA